MFRIVEQDVMLDDTKLITAYCSHSDTKPENNFATGSFCMEVDTGKTYLYDEEASAGERWIEQNAEDGGET